VSRWRRFLRRVGRRSRAASATGRDHGFWRPGELDRVVVLSPHLDDAVLSVGDVLAVAPVATVVTVFAGSPEAYPDPPSAWSLRCGFGPGDDIGALRRAEDEHALHRLGADPVHLAYVEHDYRTGPFDEAIPDGMVDALATAVRAAAPTVVLLPCGLDRPEHRIVAAAALSLRAVLDGPTWVAYAELPYLCLPGVLPTRLAELVADGVVLEPLTPTSDPLARARKIEALEAYRSQVGPLDDWWSVRRRVRETPESLWRITT